MNFYIVLVILVQFTLNLVCYPYFINESLQFFKTLQMTSLGIVVLCGFLTWFVGPGFIERDPSSTQTELLANFRVNELCFECGVISLPRSYHCNVCKRCVERYDHHCPWVNSCIGSHNHSYFIIFVFFQLVYIICIVV